MRHWELRGPTLAVVFMFALIWLSLLAGVFLQAWLWADVREILVLLVGVVLGWAAPAKPGVDVAGPVR